MDGITKRCLRAEQSTHPALFLPLYLKRRSVLIQRKSSAFQCLKTCHPVNIFFSFREGDTLFSILWKLTNIAAVGNEASVSQCVTAKGKEEKRRL